MQVVIYPFKETCAGAKLLKKLSGWPFAWEVPSYDTVINWGCGSMRAGSGITVLNKGSAVSRCVNKLKSYTAFKEHGVHRMLWTKDFDAAQAWLDRGNMVFARNDIEGSDGSGVTVYSPGDRIETPFSFYTKGFPTTREFRISIVRRHVVDCAEKKPNLDTDFNQFLRTGDNWLYCKRGIRRPSDTILEQSIKAVAALGLDFGGVDIAEDVEGNTCVFEVNSAPWLGVSTAKAYINGIKEILNI